MGLIEYNRASERVRKRFNVWYWRLRYWWMDTEGGTRAHVGLLCASVLVTVMQLIKVSIAALLPPPPGEPAKSIYWWVVQLIIAIVSAIISYALRPKPKSQPPAQLDTPTVDDGQSTLEIHGDCWIDEEFILAQKVVGKVPIKSKGKK